MADQRKTRFKEDDDSIANSALSEALSDDDITDRYSSSVSRSHSSSKSRKNEPPPVTVDIETRNVYCAKLVMIGVLSIAAVASSMATFLHTTSQVDADVEKRFREYASEVVKDSQINADDHFKSFKSLSLGLASYANGANETWPHMTLPIFEAQAGNLRSQLKADWVSLVTLVEEEGRVEWESYAVDNQEWIEESRMLSGANGEGGDITPFIFRKDDEGVPYKDNLSPEKYYAPTWQITPPSFAEESVNYNWFDSEDFATLYEEIIATGKGSISGALDISADSTDKEKWPRSYLAHPVYATVKEESGPVVAMLLASVPWHSYWEDVLSEEADGIVVVMRYACEGEKAQEFSYQLNGPEVVYLGAGNLHARPRWTLSEFPADLDAFNAAGECAYSIHIYPSDQFYNNYGSNRPAIYTSIVVLIFLVTTLVFTWYDCSVDKRQDKVITTAAKTSAIVDSFFPSHILDRVMMGENGDRATSALSRVFENEILATKPIADRFPHATIMFADIVGFTAWSSVREPSQVFTLLEAVYNSFDKIAKRRRVFKVETIGDCYVAATGLPEPNDDHAVIMARFARDCLDKMREVAHQLEISLGPDTGDLTMRIGLHSGPVTGGVLRGDKSRFQLFGDTVNTAALIENTGAKDKIHLSKETAELLQAAAKGRWVKAREELVLAKGTNRIQTYWLVGGVTALSSGGASEETTSTSEGGDGVKTQTQSPDKLVQSNQNDRLVGWNVDVLTRSLKQIVAMRGQKKHEKGETAELRIDTKSGETALDEVKEIITLPSKASRSKQDPDDIDLGPEVMLQLNDYVTTIACLYQDNPFHSFQHASHVTQSLTKLLSRVAATDEIDYDDMVYKKVEASALHKFTFGITSDPLTQFACTFSALIHDLDHQGVPNSQLVKEKVAIADLYKNKSVAEQNSVDIAWEMLMEERYKDLRACIYISQAELDRFRQLVVNSVMATDIMDKELGAGRKRRWEKAFKIQKSLLSDSQTNANRKATIVIEHVIQAADVAHTMQHWHVYRKWNERLFNECYQAYLNGRAEKDPSIAWYESEIGFFDFYIIPLAKKLEECGVFGVSSDECLNYAEANRREWEMKGKGLVQEYLEPYKQGAKSGDDESGEIE